LGVELEARADAEGHGWQTGGGGPTLGLHLRGTGPGDRVSLPYFSISDMDASLNQVRELGGEVIHPGERWSVCRDSEASMEATILLNRFYEVSSAALLSQEAVLGQIAGDEGMALFVPGLAGSAYHAKAVEAGRSLLRAVGYGTAEGNWVDVGVGICSGEEFVGNVGGGGFKDFTALGDVTNTAARLQAAARGGEIIMCASTFEALRDRRVEAEPLDLQLKGKQEPVRAYRIRP